MIAYEWLWEDAILVISPQGALESADFDKITQEVDEHLQARGELAGLLIQAESFPGWEDFEALLTHLRFVRGHHKKIKKVAIVTDSGFLTFVPRVADHFVHAEVKHFNYGEKPAALAWLRTSA